LLSCQAQDDHLSIASDVEDSSPSFIKIEIKYKASFISFFITIASCYKVVIALYLEVIGVFKAKDQSVK